MFRKLCHALWKYKGHSLDVISDIDPDYIVWMADENVLWIEAGFLDAVRRDDIAMSDELKIIIDEYRYQ